MREIMLNGYIDDEVWFGDEITPEALHSLLYAEGKDPDEDVHIRLNSYGGSCNAAVRMHDDMAAYPGKNKKDAGHSHAVAIRPIFSGIRSW